MKTFPWRCIPFSTLVNRYDLRANREPHANQVQHPIFFSRKFVSADCLLTAISSAATDAFSSWTPIHRRILHCLTELRYTGDICDWSLFFRYNGMGKGYQKGGYQEQRQKGKGKGKDRGKDRDDPRLRRDDSIERRYNAPPSATSIIMLLHSFYVLPFMSMAPSNRLRNNSSSWNVLFTFLSGFPGFCDMAKLCYIQPPYPWLWVNCSIFLNSTNIQINVWHILPVTMNTLVCMAISTLEKSDVFAEMNG